MKKQFPQRLRLDIETAKFIGQHINLLNESQKTPFKKFNSTLLRGEPLSDMQHNYLDGMYETIMGKLFGSKIDIHIDLKNKAKINLKY